MERTELIAFLLQEYQATLRGISFIATPWFVVVAGYTIWAMVSGETSPEVAYPILAFCSTGLLGMGLLITGAKNAPAILGSMLSIVVVSFAMVQAAANHSVLEWVKPVYGLMLIVMPIWAALLHGIVRALDMLRREKLWSWLLIGSICAVILLGAIMSLLFAAAFAIERSPI